MPSIIMRNLVRRAVPLGFRQEIARMRRLSLDRKLGIKFARGRGGSEWPVSTELSQPIVPSAVFEAKLSNLRRGAALVDMNLIEPGGIWSFWDRIGKPTERNGFTAGRNIVGDRLVLQTGGGLCQLSSLLYHLALLGGLEIIERHHHSIDIYREEERFTPLGADATVMWGYKDLRLRNPFESAIGVGCRVEGDRLYGEIRSERPLLERRISFTHESIGRDRVCVRTMVDDVPIGTAEYIRRQGLELA